MSGYTMGMGNTQWGINRSAKTPSKTNVDVFWEDFYTRMVPRSQVRSKTEGVDFYIDKYYSHLTDKEKQQIKNEADLVLKKDPKARGYYYEGGKRTRSSRSGKTRKQKRRHHRSKKLKSRKAH